MKAAEDHVLDYALGRVFGRSDAELTARILEGCRRGRLAAERPVATVVTRRRAIVAVAALALVAWPLWWSRPAGVVATSDAPVLSARGELWSPCERAGFERGDLLVVSDPVVVRLEAGGAVTARPGTVLRIDAADSLTLALGSARIASGSRAIRIATPAGAIRIAPASSVDLVGVAADYAVDPDLTLFELARRIHVLDTTLVFSIAATLLQGAGELAAAGRVQALRPGVSVQQDAERDEAGLAQLRKQIGTWDVTVTLGGREVHGVEVCRRGSGDHSIVSQITVDLGDRSIESTELLSYDPLRRRYSGVYSDSFGGELGLLVGPRSEDLKERVLQMNKFHGGEFGIRARTQWVSDGERFTIMEMQRDGEWKLRRRMVHRRRPEPSADLFQVILNVRDMQKQVEFYRDVLGLTVRHADGVTDFRGHSWVRLSAGTMRLALHAGRKTGNSGDESRLSFLVTDLEAARARVERAGMPVSAVRQPSPSVRVVDCRDPEGNAFHLETHAGK